MLVYFIEVFMLLRKTKHLCRVIGKNICNGDDTDQGNAKITRVKKTELNMRPKTEREKSSGKTQLQRKVRRWNFIEKMYFMGGRKY